MADLHQRHNQRTIEVTSQGETMDEALANLTISGQIGKSVALQDIKVQIEISAPAADTVKVVENAAAKGTFTLVAPPLGFTVKAA